jgi:hypothetical protein
MATISKYQTSSGATLYRVRYRTPDHRQSDKRGFTTKKAAEAFAASIEVAKLRGEYIKPSLGKITVGELAADWLARKEQHTAPSHYRMLESAWRVHVASRWGAVSVSMLTCSASRRGLPAWGARALAQPQSCGHTACWAASWLTQ